MARLMIVFALITLLLVSSCAKSGIANSDPDAKAQCISQGNVWEFAGETRGWACLTLTEDASRSCADSSECVGSCITQLTSSLKEELKTTVVYSTGTCSKTKIVVGCYALVEKGAVKGVVCEQ